MTWLLYGAYGYTGRLMAKEAVDRGMRPVLAGRNEQKLRPLAEELGCEHRAFGLDNRQQIAAQLAGCEAVLHCAGPFSTTALPMMEACLAARAHYLDITGEIDVIESAAALGPRAAEAGVVVLPAVGFDVVPTDCLAAMLAAKLPGATHLRLAFHTKLDTSPGTAKTIVEALPRGGRIRREGKIVHVPLAWQVRRITFPDRPRWGVTMPWGDVASAYYSTGIENIEVYIALPRWKINLMRAARPLAPAAGLAIVQSLWKKWLTLAEKGPSAAARKENQAVIWGEVVRDDRQSAAAALATPDGYALTVEAALASVERILQRPPPPGFHTPSTAFGAEFVLQLGGVTYHDADLSGN